MKDHARVMRTLRALIRDHRYLLLGLGWAATLALGLHGFLTMHLTPLEGQEPPLPATWSNSLYRAIRLFTIDSGDVGDALELSPSLQISRFAAILVSLWTAMIAVGLLFREQVGLVRLWLSRKHDVVVGLGDEGTGLAHDLLDRGHRVVALDADPHGPNAQAVRDRGAIVLAGGAGAGDDLDRVRPHRARRVFVLTADDGANIEFALEAARHLGPAPDGEDGHDRVFVQVADPQLHGALCTITESWPADARRFRIISPPARVARRFFDRLPPDAGLEGAPDPRQVRLIVFGKGALASAVVRRAAQTCHYANGRRSRVTLCAPGADEALGNLIRDHAGLDILLEADAVDPARTPDALQALVEDALGDPNVLATFVLCLEDARDAVVWATRVAACVRGRLPLAVHVPEPRGAGRLLGAGPIGGTPLRPFPDPDDTDASNPLCDDDLDRLARAMHDHYRLQKQRFGWGGNPLVDVPWEDLPESFRDANRQSADHIAVKLRAVGARAEPGDDTPDSPAFAFTQDEVEILSRMEHARWCAERVLKGWVLGPERDDARRVHPSLIPWSDLSEVERDKDRSTVRNIPELMRLAGMRIVRC